jgi:hypothetical protein
MEEVLLTTINENEALASFLELNSLHHLSEAPTMALRHVTATLLPDAYHEYLDSCTNAISLAQLFVQIKFFLNNGSTVGEHLYGLVQATKSEKGSYRQLSSTEKKMCVISMLLPFALMKLKETSLTPDYDDDGHTADIEGEGMKLSRSVSLLENLQRLQSYILRSIKNQKNSIATVCMMYKLVMGAQQLSYLFSKTSSFYPIHQYLGISLIRKKFLPDVAKSAGTKRTPSTTSNHTVSIIFITALCFKVVEMLNRVDVSPSSGGESETDSENMNHFPPPEPPRVVGKLCQLPHDTQLCPLCEQRQKEPSASRGGYIFCHSCLEKSLTRHPYCPITGIHSTVDDIIRLKS